MKHDGVWLYVLEGVKQWGPTERLAEHVPSGGEEFPMR
jgi:hypothetical protein